MKVNNLHEYLITKKIVDTVLDEVKKNKVKKVLDVTLIIGKLTVLGVEQVKFYYELLTKETVLKNSTLIIEEEEPLVECEICGYRGDISCEKGELHHFLSRP